MSALKISTRAKPKAKPALRAKRLIGDTPEFDLLAFIAVVASCERVCVYCGCSDSMGCPEGCSWALLHRCTPTGVCSRCVPEHAKSMQAPLRYPPHQPNSEVME